MSELTEQTARMIFGSPVEAAADLHELRVWSQARTSLQPCAASSAARELCVDIDPTWAQRALTNERVHIHTKPRGYGVKVKVSESTVEMMAAAAEGKDHRSIKPTSSKNYETLWPGQSCSWASWVGTALDQHREDATEIRQHLVSGSMPRYVHPAVLMMAVRKGGNPYLDEIASLMKIPQNLWKFGCTTIPMRDMNHEVIRDSWTRGLDQFQQEWLDMFPNGELAMWLRSVICNGWMTSRQLAWTMGLNSARSCEQSWI